MKILLIHNKYKQPGGEDSVFYAESNLLSNHGHEVSHLVYDNSVIKSFYDKFLCCLKTIYNPDSARVLRLKILELRPDVIHIHNFLPLVSPSVFFVANRLGVPVILTLHNYRLICPSATLFFEGHVYERSIHSLVPLDAIWKGVYRNSRIETAIVAFMTAAHNVLGTWRNKVDYYITLTRFANEKFQSSRLSIPKHKLIVKANFIDDEGRGSIIRQDYFLFIGRLTEEKGVAVLLKAAYLLDFKLVIIGDGPMNKTVRESAEKNSNINFLGFQPKPVIMSYLKDCKGLIFPSIWYEGFPITLLEGLSTGTPIIASRLGGMAEIIEDRVNGIHFTPGDERDLAYKIEELMRDSSLAARISKAARLSYLKYFTPAVNYGRLIDIYQKAIDAKIRNVFAAA